jgi:CRISPR type III-A-associated RAMP protein Csm4
LKEVGEWLGGQIEQPPFAFSAALPIFFKGKCPFLRFYPRPGSFEASFADLDLLTAEIKEATGKPLKALKASLSEAAKKFKRISHVSEGLFTNIIQGKVKPGEALGDLLKQGKKYVQNGSLLMTALEAQALREARIGGSSFPIQTMAVQHNHLDRVAGATAEGLLFYQDETFFSACAGLWALLRCRDAETGQLVKAGLRFLEDTGLGANRSSGKGQFKITVEPAPSLPVAQNPNGVLTLSRYLPSRGELQRFSDQTPAYRITTLRPKREQRFPAQTQTKGTPPIYKDAVRMFEPGSVLPLATEDEIIGRLAQVATGGGGQVIYQSGAAIPIVIQIQEAQDVQ